VDDNPWLELFYDSAEGRKTYALPLQLHFLATRFRAMRQMRGLGGSWVLDRTWYEDAEVFARGHFEDGLMAAHEFELYQRLYVELLHSPAARPPRLLIYLFGPLETIVERIETRGRPKERETELAYWAALHDRYERWIARFRQCPVLRIDVRDYDLIADPSAIDSVASLVRRRLEPELPQTDLWPTGGHAVAV
jgi:deoxyadenosine/deoxycytidine kinase